MQITFELLAGLLGLTDMTELQDQMADEEDALRADDDEMPIPVAVLPNLFNVVNFH